MERTVFPPFTLGVTAVDALTALGHHVRISMDMDCAGAMEVVPAAPEPDDVVFGCPGFTLAVEPEALIQLEGTTLDWFSAEFVASAPTRTQISAAA